MVAWKDKRVVTPLSTKHDESLGIIARKKKGHGEIAQIMKPLYIAEYNNQYMSG